MNPSDNFYLYVNKSWKINNPIPDDKARWSQFDILNEKVQLKLKNILENKLDKNNKLSKLYYQSFEKYNNIDLIDKYINQIDSVKNINKLFELSIDYYFLFNINFLFTFDVHSDFNNSSKNILYIDTTGLGLPSKEYYSLESKEEIRSEYKKFIDVYSTLFNLSLNVDDIFNFEKLLADKSFTREQEQHIDLINNVVTYDQIISDYPNLKHLIDYYFNKINKPFDEINIINLEFCKLINNLDQLDILKNFLKFKLVNSVYYFINTTVENTYYDFYEKKLSGKIILEPKWKKTIGRINSLLGQELGKYFI